MLHFHQDGLFFCVKGKHLIIYHSQVWQNCPSAQQCKSGSPSPEYILFGILA